jgi:SP family sugar:H+ symporter-like MFS transporter
VFAGCCAALFFIVFFFVIESKDRTLEEIDQMYVDHVNPIKTKSASRQSSQELRSRPPASSDDL